MSNAFIRKLFARGRALRGEQPTDYGSIEASSTGGLTAEYEKLIQLHLKRWGVSESCVSIEARQVAQDDQGRDIIVGMVRLAGWDRKPALRLMLGLPMLETKIRRTLAGLWLNDVSRFGGLWLQAGGELNDPPAVSELRQLLVNLTGPRADAARKAQRPDTSRPAKL